jgi:hypothetical protein
VSFHPGKPLATELSTGPPVPDSGLVAGAFESSGPLGAAASGLETGGRLPPVASSDERLESLAPPPPVPLGDPLTAPELPLEHPAATTVATREGPSAEIRRARFVMAVCHGSERDLLNFRQPFPEDGYGQLCARLTYVCPRSVSEPSLFASCALGMSFAFALNHA